MDRLVGSKQRPRTLASPPPSTAPCFLVLCLVLGMAPYAEILAGAAELHLHRVVLTCVVLAVAALFYWSVLSINLHAARRHAEEETKSHPRPAAATGGATPRSAGALFFVLCLVMGALPYAEVLVAAASDLQIHPAVAAGIFLAFAALFHATILSL